MPRYSQFSIEKPAKSRLQKNQKISKFYTVLLKRSQVEQNCQQKIRPGMDEGWSQVSQTSFSQIRSASSPHKVFESLFFSASVSFKAFFDECFVIKSLSGLSKLLVESNKVSKTVLGSKIHALYAEILVFFQYKVRRIFKIIKNRQNFKFIFLNFN